MNQKKIILLVFIFLLAAILRFYQLESVAGSLNWDEVSIGYNAYSLLKTGRDEYGSSLPLLIRSFGDYKGPVYTYLTSLAVAIFGLNPFGVRFFSALFGSLSVWATYLFVKELLFRKKFGETVSFLAAFFMAVSPWSIQFSRIGFETHTSQFSVLFGAWLFLRGIRKRDWRSLYLGAVSLSLSIYLYHSAKLFVPLLIVGLLVYGFGFFIKKRTLTAMLLLFFFVLQLPWLFDSRATARGRSVMFTNQQTELLKVSVASMVHDKQRGDYFGQLFHNRRVVYTLKFFENYLDHFNPSFLFVTGDNPRHHAPEVGVLYLASLPFILLGMGFLILKNFRAAVFLLLWLLAAPLASSLATDAPNSQRSLIFLPTWPIFEAAGWFWVYQFFKGKSRYYKIFITFLGLVFIANITYYLHQYFVHTNTDYQRFWQYGYRQAVEKIQSFPDSQVVFARDIEQGYIFYLFYTKYDPKKYLSDGGSLVTQKDCYSIENVYFGECRFRLQPGDIYVTSREIREKAFLEKEKILFANGEVAVYIYEYVPLLKLKEQI